MLAPCVRFSADGTLRGPDNYVIARHGEGGWQVGGRMHRELECEGPVRVRLTSGLRQSARLLGPFSEVHTCQGMLYGDGACLDITVSGRPIEARQGVSSLTVTLEGGPDAKA
jgi:hypothetical protein